MNQLPAIEQRPLAALRDDPPLLDALKTLYRDAFFAPPWHDTDDDLDSWCRRTLTTDAERPGAVLATATKPRRPAKLVGFATAWQIGRTFPTGGPSYDAIAAALGEKLVASHLLDALEVDELAVLSSARGSGIGRALLATVVAPGQRAWLVTGSGAEAALGLYRSLGWTELRGNAASGEPVVVFATP